MRTPWLALSLSLVGLVLLAPVARADIVDLRDGRRLPSTNDVTTPWGSPPKDEELEATKGTRVQLAYDRVEIGRDRLDAAQVVKEQIYVSAANVNQRYIAAETYGFSGFWQEAAQAFIEAAGELKDAAREVSLYKAMLARRNSGDAELALEAANNLLKEFPKTIYFGPAQELRARIFATQGKMPEAIAALDLVISAPGMNAWDLFNAKYLSVWLQKYVTAQTPEQLQAAEKALRDLLREIDAHAGRKFAEEPRQKVVVALASTLRGLGKADEAKALFGQILAAATARTDPSVLAGVYYGLGDTLFEEASRLQESAGGDAARKEQVRQILERAGLHYLRVTLLYAGNAGQRELYGATRGAARVFAQLFRMSDEKDCELATRAYEFYRRAVDMQGRGEERRTLVREGLALQERIKAMCGGGETGGVGDEEDNR